MKIKQAITRKVRSVLGWNVSATPLVSSDHHYWIGMFDGQQIAGRFRFSEDVFYHVESCMKDNVHPAKTTRHLQGGIYAFEVKEEQPESRKFRNSPCDHLKD